jgi:hypothetical protein
MELARDWTDLIGGTLVAGCVVFLVGAVGWRLAYQRPPEESLPLIHAQQRRWTWIHRWMLVAMFITPAGITGLAQLPDLNDVAPLVAMAAVGYALGAVCMIVSLCFRLTVVPWAAERTVAVGTPPDGFAALEAWAGRLYVVHMLASYSVFVLLGAAVLASDVLSPWSGWVGVGLGAGCLAGFVATRFAGPFNPPFMAHTYTALLGIVLLLG